MPPSAPSPWPESGAPTSAPSSSSRTGGTRTRRTGFETCSPTRPELARAERSGSPEPSANRQARGSNPTSALCGATAMRAWASAGPALRRTGGFRRVRPIPSTSGGSSSAARAPGKEARTGQQLRYVPEQLPAWREPDEPTRRRLAPSHKSSAGGPEARRASQSTRQTVHFHDANPVEQNYPVTERSGTDHP